MVYKATPSDLGLYIDESGKRYDILEATSVATPQGKDYGWTEYESIEKAAEGFKLTLSNTSITAQKLQDQINELKESNQMLTDCLLEVSELVYQ